MCWSPWGAVAAFDLVAGIGAVYAETSRAMGKLEGAVTDGSTGACLNSSGDIAAVVSVLGALLNQFYCPAFIGGWIWQKVQV